jgi:hypothetical protein
MYPIVLSNRSGMWPNDPILLVSFMVVVDPKKGAAAGSGRLQLSKLIKGFPAPAGIIFLGKLH